MKKLIPPATVALALLSFSSWADTHCQANEVVYFSCKIANSQKVVSLCGGDLSKPESFWLQYRFGILGKPELIFPPERKDSSEKFKGEVLRGGLRLESISFKNNGVTYAVENSFASQTGFGFRGVRVSQANKEITLNCGTVHTDKLLELAGNL